MIISTQIYERHIPVVQANIKLKDLQTQWITKGIKNSKKNFCFISSFSKVNKQSLYKSCKSLFEKST